MQRLVPLAYVLFALLTPPTSAQVLNPGDIGCLEQTSNVFWVVRPNASCTSISAISRYPVPTGGVTRAILHDPNQPDSFLIGGSGFIGRATVTSFAFGSFGAPLNASAAWTPLATAPNVGNVQQMAWDQNGNLLFADAVTDQVRRLDLATNTVTDVTTGPQPWTQVQSLACHPASGDIYVGSLQAVYRMASGNAPQLLASGWCIPLGCSISGLALDPATDDVLATLINSGPGSHHMVRIAPSGTWANEVPMGGLPRGRNSVNPGLAAAQFIVGAGNNSTPNYELWCVTNGVPVPLGPFTPHGTCVGCNSPGVAVVGATTQGPLTTNDFRLNVTTSPTAGTLIDLQNTPPLVQQGMALFSTTLPTLPGAGFVAGLIPDATTFALFTPSPVPGSPLHWSGSSPYPVAIPAGALAGLTLDMVVIGMDGGFGTIDVTPVARF